MSCRFSMPFGRMPSSCRAHVTPCGSRKPASRPGLTQPIRCVAVRVFKETVKPVTTLASIPSAPFLSVSVETYTCNWYINQIVTAKNAYWCPDLCPRFLKPSIVQIIANVGSVSVANQEDMQHEEDQEARECRHRSHRQEAWGQKGCAIVPRTIEDWRQ